MCQHGGVVFLSNVLQAKILKNREEGIGLAFSYLIHQLELMGSQEKNLGKKDNF